MGYDMQHHIDAPYCPYGHGEMKAKKSWPLKGRGRKSAHKPTGCIVHLFECPKCGFQKRQIGKE